jgi:hypothetical protein
MVLSYCIKGHVFASAFQFRGGTAIIQHNHEFCRICGSPANTIDGKYQIGFDGITTLIEGSEFDKELVRIFHTLLTDV